jgi:AAA domain
MTASAVRVVTERPEVFRREGLGYVYAPVGLPLILHADYLHRRSDEFTAELMIDRTDFPLTLHAARVNLTSTASRKTYANHIKDLLKDDAVFGGVNWMNYFEQFCQAIIKTERAGGPYWRARDLPTAARPTDMISRLLPGTGPMVWFAAQGSGKGWAAMVACAAIASGRSFAGLATRQARPVYLDWEDSPEVWQERLTAVSIGLDLPELPDVHYHQCRQRFATELPQLLRYIESEQIGLVVIDSVGPAMGGSDGQRWDDQTVAFFEALRHLNPLPVLLIDHVSGETIKGEPSGQEKAFGSIYKMAEVRGGWYIRKEQETDADEQRLAFYHRKFNHTRKFPAMGVRLRFESDAQGWATSVAAERWDVRESELLSRGLSQPDQVEAFLQRNGPSTTEVLAQGLDLKENHVRAVAGRLRKANRIVHLDDGTWALGSTGWWTQ